MRLSVTWQWKDNDMPSQMQTNKDKIIKGKDHVGNAARKKLKVRNAKGNPGDKPREQKSGHRIERND